MAPQPITALAFNTDVPEIAKGDRGAYERHFANIAGFALRLIEALRDENGFWLPTGVALNINYPPLAPSEIAGLAFVEQGRGPDKGIRYSFRNTGDPETLVSSMIWEPISLSEGPRSDIAVFHDAQRITIVPIDNNITTPESVQDRVKNGLSNLRP